MIKYYFMLGLNIVMMCIGQLLFKYGTSGKSLDSIENIIRVMFQPVIIFALLDYVLATIVWLYVLTKLEISVAYPIQSMAIPLVSILSMVFFSENFAWSKIVGLVVMLIGIFIITR